MSASLASLNRVRDDFAESLLHSTSIAVLLLRAAQWHARAGVRLLSARPLQDERFLSYPALLTEAQRILGGISALGRPRGEKIALLLERPGDFIPAFWACVLGGYVPCPMAPISNDPERWAAHLAHVNTLLDQPLFITTGAMKDNLPGVSTIDLATLRGSAPNVSIYDAGLDETAVLMLTSGSTGNSKAVVLTHGNLLASMAGKAERQQMSASDIALNWISFDHVAALLEVHLVSLYVGATQLHSEPAPILADPLLFLRFIHHHRVTLTFSPNFLLGQINAALPGSADTLHTLDLSCLRYIISGGEANVVETGRQFLELLQPCRLPGTVLRPAFGMTETCAGSIYSTVFPQVDAGREFASVGTPIPGMHIRIVDEHGALAGPGEPGELQVRGTMIFTQYYNNETATHSAFTADGWFQTGDLGCIDEGRLTLVGRSKDSIIVSGVNYFSHELEAVLEQLEGIERSHVAVFPTRPKGADTEQLVIAFATSMPLDDEKLYQRLIAIRSTTIMMWGFRPSLILPLPKQAFPKTSLGKTQRSLMRKRLESSGFAEEVATVSALIGRQLGGYVAPEGAAEAAVTAIYADVFGLDPGGMGATANFFDLGGTSLDIFKLKQRLEKHFGIADVPIVMLLQNPTARALAKRLAPGSAGEVDRYDPVVPLQLAGGKLPFFCVHPGIGEVLVFVNLAKYFVNERPFYALRARGFRNDEPYFASFDEMAMAYVNAIRERQPAGPYVLAGYSLGAPIAVEIARILESQGERVAFIACIDGPPCRVIGGLDEIDIAVSLAFFLSLIEKKDLLILPTRYRVSGEDFCANLVQNAPASRLAELNLDLPGFRRWAALSHALNALGATHMESTDCKLVDSVTAFHAEPLRFTPEDWRNRIYAWDECTRQPNRYIEVDGDHASLLGPKHVGTFQALLRAEIDRATGGR